MRRSIINSVLVLVTAATLAGCQKYEDGPFISLRTREQRIANYWRVDTYLDGGVNISSNFLDYDLDLSRDGNASLYAWYEVNGVSFDLTTNGTWQLVNSSEDLRLDFDDNAADEVYEILRLKEKELWLRVKDDDIEIHLRPY